MQAMMKQLLLAQSSDWPFLVSTGSAVDYASTRFHNHASDTLAMADIVEKAALGALSEEDKKAIDTVERRDPLFPEILDVLGVRPSGERT
jgi:1,4-alpha-glucan branching enzyme